MHIETLDMTPERKQRFSDAAKKLIDICTKDLEGPIEAIMVLQIMLDSLKEKYNVQSARLMSERDVREGGTPQ